MTYVVSISFEDSSELKALFTMWIDAVEFIEKNSTWTRVNISKRTDL